MSAGRSSTQPHAAPSTPRDPSYSRSLTTVLLLAFSDGHKEFIDDAHVHGFRDDQLLIATGVPGAGLTAELVRTVRVADLSLAETCARDDEPDDDGSGGSRVIIGPGA